MTRWIPFELHTHTNRSDGGFSVPELFANAQKLGIDGIALTDHNTICKPAELEAAARATGLRVIGGMEWTTFDGHILLLNIRKYFDWRTWGRSELGRAIKEVHDQGGLIGIAHPFQLGYPICTGGHWDYSVANWSEIDYLEVWHGARPSLQTENIRAFQLWTQLLNEGYRITAVSGRDWHFAEPDGRETFAVTCLGVGDEPRLTAKTESCVAALWAGAVCVTLGPLLQLEVYSSHRTVKWEVGEVISSAEREPQLEVKMAVKPLQTAWCLKFDPKSSLRVRINSNLGRLNELSVMVGEEYRHSVMSEGLSWIRAELFSWRDGEGQLIAFTNPIYFNLHASTLLAGKG